MVHNLTIGHLDCVALRQGKLVVEKPLDMEMVDRLLNDLGEVNQHGQRCLGGFPVEIRDGCVICPWLVVTPNLCLEAFARQLQQQTGCVMADVKRREIIAIEQFARRESQTLQLVSRAAPDAPKPIPDLPTAGEIP